MIDPANSCFCHNAVALSGLAADERLCFQLNQANVQTGGRIAGERDKPARDP